MILYIGSNVLNFPPEWGLVDSSEFGLKMVIDKGFYLAVIYSIFWTILRSVDFVGIKLKDKAAQTESKVDDGLIPFAIDLTKVVIIIFALVIILGNVFGVNITALIAGLGVGGVAIALASKESIENLLGSFTIFFDKPFKVGDVITLGDVTGKVEKVGFRSTRIRTYGKSVVTVPNKNIINTELDNLGVRPVRRVKFNIGLTYDTSIEQIKNIVNDIQKLVDDHPMTNDDGRVRFLSFGSSSLDIMVLYYVNSPAWEDLIDAQQKINYSIIEIVNKHNSEFAFPSTSIYVEKNSN
jgi:MscS family membrane protein